MRTNKATLSKLDAQRPRTETLYLFKKLTKRATDKRIDHELKIEPQYFNDIKSGNKTAEIRCADRDFCVGDYLTLREFNLTEGYTARFILCEITHIVSVNVVTPEFQGKPGLVMLSFKIIHIKG